MPRKEHWLPAVCTRLLQHGRTDEHDGDRLSWIRCRRCIPSRVYPFIPSYTFSSNAASPHSKITPSCSRQFALCGGFIDKSPPVDMSLAVCELASDNGRNKGLK